MITLTLLHPRQSTPVRSWTFENNSAITIGRSSENDVVLYSSVVSRHHVEIRRINNTQWEISNLGTNGTYIDGKRISKIPAENGIIFQLARSGPQIQVYTNKQPIKTIWPNIIGANAHESDLTDPDITISETHETCP